MNSQIPLHPPLEKGEKGGLKEERNLQEDIMKIRLSFLFPILFVTITLGCATTGDVTKLKNDVLSVERKQKEMESSLSDIRKNQAELGVKIDTLQSDIQTLIGRFEEGRYQTEKSLRDVTSVKENYSLQIKELENRLNNIKNRISSIELSISGVQPSAPPETKPSSPPESKEKEKEKEKEKSPDDAYKEAYATFKHGEIGIAKDMFKRFLKAHPKGEYSDNAQYWLGECYYVEKDYENAILAFEDLIKKFPKSEKVPSAMLKQGYSFYELRDKASGKLLMERVIEKYPKSEEASLAKKRIKEEASKSIKKKK
jgi:tol-pal system protein YbgF